MHNTPSNSKEPFIVPHCEQAVDIVYQDEHLLLIHKPSGLLSVPGKHPDNRDSLITRLQANLPQARIVHRLDMDTSGIMVVALSADCHRASSSLFAERKVYKEYEAKVFNLLEHDTGTIDLPLICDWPNRPKQKVDYEQGKSAITYYETLDRYTQTKQSHVRLKPKTGRSHQLRIHLAEIGHPILGCDFYAHAQANAMADRLLLHATKLSFIHPITGKPLEGYSPCPF